MFSGLDWALQARYASSIIIEYADGVQHCYSLGVAYSHQDVMNTLSLSFGFNSDLRVAVPGFVLPYLTSMHVTAVTIHQ